MKKEDDKFIDKSKFQIEDNGDVEIQNKTHNIQKQALGCNTRR